MDTTATTPATSSVAADMTEQVMGVLERATHPLTFFQIQRRLPRSFQTRTDELRQLLNELASQKRIHEFAPYRSKAPRFWTREPRQFAHLTIVEVLGDQPITQRELMIKIRKRLQGVPESELRQMMAQMLLDGHLRKLPPRLGGRSNLLSAREVQPGDYLTPVFQAMFDTLAEVYKRLESEGVRRETFQQEAEAMWRALPWDELANEPSPRPEEETAAESEEASAHAETPFEPAAAATESPPPAAESVPTPAPAPEPGP